MRTQILLASIATASLLFCNSASAATSAGGNDTQAQPAERNIVLAQGGRFGGGGSGGGGGGRAGSGGGGGGGRAVMGGGSGPRVSRAPSRFYAGGGARGVRWASQPRRWGTRPYYRYGRYWGPGWGWGYGLGWGLGLGYPYYAGAPYYYYDDAPVVVEGGGEGYCARRFKSYDPASGTYLGYDGKRHPCP